MTEHFMRGFYVIYQKIDIKLSTYNQFVCNFKIHLPYLGS